MLYTTFYSPKIAALSKVKNVSHHEWQWECQDVEQYVNDCPREDTFAKISATATGVAEAAITTHGKVFLSHSLCSHSGK